MTIAIIQTASASHRQAWYGQDMLLSWVSLDLEPQLVLCVDAIDHLRVGCDQLRHGKSLQKRYQLLELYDAPTPWVVHDLELIPASEWIIPVEQISSNALVQRLAQFNKILHFNPDDSTRLADV
ncbi:hypothetical protein [Pseudidiomarina taiwanensis]|uniref:Uncharacterized protein n=1 Tax=Pseudidiomarina taiwanensis TaxID=337250 RepID=A0A432ZN60_9GAMM|nr:hypothetical protein [Pseudidiomarina taiwanensis]RUO79329.1 hypothetical protein CWI83_02110 [Pseudidiomarina taiwanensis]